MTGHLVPLLTCDGCQYRQVPATHRDQTLPQYGDDYGFGLFHGEANVVTGRRVIAVDCMQHFTIYVDALADIDVAEVSAWVEDGDYVDDAPCDDVSYSGHVLDVGHVRNVLSRGYGVVVMDNDRCHVGNVSTWDDLVAMRQQIEPDPKAPMTGQLDIFGGEVES